MKIGSKICPDCGDIFQYSPSHNAQRYCSKCGIERGKDYRKEPCIKCGKPRAYNAEHGVCKSCSHRIPEFHNWKGGEYIARGYRKILSHEHKRADPSGYVLEHILVWEKANGREIPDGWIIHHLNGIRRDNRIENLLALPRKNHHADLVNQALKVRIRQLENEIRKLKASVKFI